jgi:hypothetical protein
LAIEQNTCQEEGQQTCEPGGEEHRAEGTVTQKHGLSHSGACMQEKPDRCEPEDISKVLPDEHERSTSKKQHTCGPDAEDFHVEAAATKGIQEHSLNTARECVLEESGRHEMEPPDRHEHSAASGHWDNGQAMEQEPSADRNPETCQAQELPIIRITRTSDGFRAFAVPRPKAQHAEPSSKNTLTECQRQDILTHRAIGVGLKRKRKRSPDVPLAPGRKHRNLRPRK